MNQNAQCKERCLCYYYMLSVSLLSFKFMSIHPMLISLFTASLTFFTGESLLLSISAAQPQTQ